MIRPAHEPRRDDDVATWIKETRDQYDRDMQPLAWHALDSLLDDYRLHADVGEPLFVEVHEGGVEFE